MPAFQNLSYTAAVLVENEIAGRVTDTLNLRRVGVRNAAQRWRLRVTFQPTVPVFGGANPMAAFAHACAMGLLEKFTLEMPQWVPAGGSGGTTMTGTAGNDTVAFQGKVPPVGRFISVAGSAKVYIVTGTTSIFPALAASAARAVVNRTPNLRCQYSDDFVRLEQDGKGVVRTVRDFVEAL